MTPSSPALIGFIRLMSTPQDNTKLQGQRLKRSFLSDCWKAFVISGGYGMGDPLAPTFRRNVGEQRRGEASPAHNRLKSPGREARNRRKDCFNRPTC